MRTILIALVAALAACDGSPSPPSQAPTPPVAKVDRRPDWTVKLPDGKSISAADYDGKVVLVNFWATWCPPCVEEVPDLISLQKQYEEKGLRIVAFSQDTDAEKHDRFLAQSGMNYPSAFGGNDDAREAIMKFQKISPSRYIPTTFVIDRKGNIVFKQEGAASRADFEKIILPLF